MNRVSYTLIGKVAVTGLMAAGLAVLSPASVPVAAQTAPPRATAVRGTAQVLVTKPVTKVVGTDVVTTIRVKNVSTGFIPGLKIDENWYDKASNPVGGDTYRHKTPFQPGEIIEVVLKSPKNPKMNSNNLSFSYQNGQGKVETKTADKL